LGRVGDFRAMGDDDEGQALSVTEVVEELEDLVLALGEGKGDITGEGKGGITGIDSLRGKGASRTRT